MYFNKKKIIKENKIEAFKSSKTIEWMDGLVCDWLMTSSP